MTAGCPAIAKEPSSDAHERGLFFDRTYEPGTLALFDALLSPGDTMVDVGANLGIMTLHAARAVGLSGRVIALEPHPDYFPRLSEHVALNGLTNTTLLQNGGRRNEFEPPDMGRAQREHRSLVADSAGIRTVEDARVRAGGTVG